MSSARKPMVETLAEADEIIASAEAANATSW